jgi:RimJ/RimL family protein N-acetyltransferase
MVLARWGVIDSRDQWLNVRPAERIEGTSAAGAGVILRRAHRGDLDELVGAVNDSLGHLRPWMPWAQQPATAESIGAFLDQADLRWEARREFHFAVRGERDRHRDSIIGFCGLHDRPGPGALEIGYWVHVDCTGRGVGTAAAEALTRSALLLEGVDRVEIRCDAGNMPSAAIPRRLGFRLDRVEIRPAEAPGETDRQMIWVFDPTSEGGPR